MSSQRHHRPQPSGKPGRRRQTVLLRSPAAVLDCRWGVASHHSHPRHGRSAGWRRWQGGVGSTYWLENPGSSAATAVTARGSHGYDRWRGPLSRRGAAGILKVDLSASQSLSQNAAGIITSLLPAASRLPRPPDGTGDQGEAVLVAFALIQHQHHDTELLVALLHRGEHVPERGSNSKAWSATCSPQAPKTACGLTSHPTNSPVTACTPSPLPGACPPRRTRADSSQSPCPDYARQLSKAVRHPTKTASGPPSRWPKSGSHKLTACLSSRPI